MTENVQCPVCTLYLHAGMNLSDHLETHPKEQVIRALVQMTISSGSGVGQGNAALATVLGGETSSTGNDTKKFNSEKEEKPLPPNLKEEELNAGSGIQSCNASTIANSTSNSPALKHNGSKNSDNILNYSTSNSEGRNESEHLRKDHSPSSLFAKAAVKAEINSTVKDHSVGNNENVNECFTKNTFSQSNASSNSTTITSNSYHQAPVQLTNSNSIQNSFSLFSGNQRYDQQQQRNSTNNQNQIHTTPRMPPPPPPPTSQSQLQDINRGILPSGPSGTFHSIQPQQLTHSPLPPHHLNTTPSSSNHRQQQMFVGQHQTSSNSQHQQNLKVIYAPTLPPPPPLQLFTYQPPTHLQHHQKPPPAYGTAISQIRSQNNQNKQQVTGSPAAHQQHQTLQAHIALQQQQVQNLHQQQNLHHNVRIHVPPPPPPIPTPVKLSYSSKNQELPAQHHAATVRNNHQQLHQHHQNKTVLLQQQQQQPQQQQQQQQQQHNNNENIQNSKNHINSNEILNKSTKSSGSSTSAGAGTSASTVNNANTPSHPHVSISPSTASASMAAVAASTLGRHTNSPFAALLAAAAGAPSPSTSSSVLRYAESPVAHYLERENGDFIVQETPKHIVECVETDNGEFSVIERIYQSPPSVLHIHDDDEDDDDDDEDSGRDQIESSVHNESSDIKSKKQEVTEDSDNEKNKQNINENHKKIKNSSNDNCKKLNHSDDPHQSGSNEIVDFVSISSDSGDEEEFISQDRNDNSTTESSIKIQPSTTPSSTSQTTLSVLSSSSYSVATALGSDDHSSPSTSNSIPSNSLHSPSTVNTAQTQQNLTASTSNGNTVRKKSSKNTITVLSDVQLNLNEYLDLVGNIIASSKVAAQRKTLASIAPMPLVKIEKEEPIDEYITTYPSTANTNFEIVPPPLKANKHETEETTDNHSSSSSSYIETNNHNISLINEIKQDEKDEKKPQVLENITGNETALSSFANSNAPTSSTTINSSHVTSVIRMASTSQHQAQQQQHTQQLQSLENNKNSNEAEDLSQPQSKVQPMTNVKSMSQPSSLARKGPKKLIIKPKSSKTEVLQRENKQHQNINDNDQQLPTTSGRAKEESIKHITDDAAVQVKNEPITSIAYENQQQTHQPFQATAGFSILEQHLNSKEPILDFKEEKPCLTEASVPATTIIKEMKVENNVNDDARVLYDFANSKKSQNESPSVFPSSMSVFSNIQTSTENASANAVQQKSKLINQEMDNSASSSTYSSQSAMDVTIPSEGQNESTTTTNTSTANGQSHQQAHQIFTDFPFSYLYNNIPGTNEQVDVKNIQQFTTFYQNGSHGNNSSGNINNNNNSSALLLEDSSSTKHYNEYEQQHHLNHNQVTEHQQPSTSHQPWFNNTNYAASEHNVASVSTNHSTANINSLSVDGSAALDSTEVGKYLDLDACKREQNIDMTAGERVTVPPPPPPSSSTSCSFNGATDNSMAGICSTGATLNIRTDEKMPAKGEISEQESNCDIDNSWSQPMYGDISARFFKTTFPGIFPQDNGWNHDEYFTVHDLSASTTAQATNSNSNINRSKSFDPNSSTNNSCSMPMFSQNTNDNCNMDVMPSTSAKIRKRRKRSSQDNKMSQENAKRIHPTSTVTSQQILMQNTINMPGAEFNFHQQQQQQMQIQQQPHLQQPSTSTAFLAGPSNVANTSLTSNFMIPQQQQQPHQAQSQLQHKQRTKVYECGHCNAKYSKLKDRNAHMIDAHNYVRQNRRLICPTTGLATPVTNTDVQDVAVPTTSAASGNVMASMQPNTDCVADFKQSIVKIENENIHRDLNCAEPISADLSAKTEIVEDNKQQLALIPLNTESSITNNNLECDMKPSTNSLPLSLTTSSSKLTTLYRMLVSFNMTTLKQNQSLTEFDENLIKSSIFFCYICRQNFNSVKLYDAHLTEHPAECFTCGKKFQRWKNFSLHLKRHLGWKEFGCTVCDKKFVVRSALVEHTRMHSGLSPLKCKICGKHFKRYSNLTQHRKRHTKQIVRRKEYVCYCGEVLPSKARFLWHKETHDSKPKCCPHCCDRFVHVNSLRRHIRLAHSDKFDYTEPMECPICKQIFAKASMKAHMATHSTETQYDCAICSKSFSTKWNLKIHSWVHANRTAKPFKCEHCPKAFVREVDFKNHMNSHKQIKPYTCEVCGCKFIRKYNYMRHRREHHGNKKYTCDLCKKSFHRHYYLIEHRRIHTGERPFQCTICGKSSTTKTNHNKHLKIHHSRDPFTVEV